MQVIVCMSNMEIGSDIFPECISPRYIGPTSGFIVGHHKLKLICFWEGVVESSVAISETGLLCGFPEE